MKKLKEYEDYIIFKHNIKMEINYFDNISGGKTPYVNYKGNRLILFDFKKDYSDIFVKYDGICKTNKYSDNYYMIKYIGENHIELFMAMKKIKTYLTSVKCIDWFKSNNQQIINTIDNFWCEKARKDQTCIGCPFAVNGYCQKID